MSPTLKDARIRVHKEIAHITANRLDKEGNKDWHFSALANELETAFEAFLAGVPSTNLDPDAIDLYRRRPILRGPKLTHPLTGCTGTPKAAEGAIPQSPSVRNITRSG